MPSILDVKCLEDLPPSLDTTTVAEFPPANTNLPWLDTQFRVSENIHKICHKYQDRHQREREFERGRECECERVRVRQGLMNSECVGRNGMLFKCQLSSNVFSVLLYFSFRYKIYANTTVSYNMACDSAPSVGLLSLQTGAAVSNPVPVYTTPATKNS